MSVSSAATDQNAAAEPPVAGPTRAAVAAGALGLMAAWTAAGSIGLVAAPLRHAVVWILLGAAGALARPRGRRLAWLAAAAALVVGLSLFAPGQSAADAAAVAVFIAVLSGMGRRDAAGRHAPNRVEGIRLASQGRGSPRTPPRRETSDASPAAPPEREGLPAADARLLVLVGVAAGVLAIWRLAVATIPTAVSLAGALGEGMGDIAGWIAGRPLNVGASFAGLDFLVPMAVIWIGWLRWTLTPRWKRAVWAAGAIVAAHLAYLAVVARANDLVAFLPDPPAPPSLDASEYRPPEWLLSETLRAAIPWNLPILAACLHAIVAGCMFRWGRWAPADGRSVGRVAPRRLGAAAALAFVAVGVLAIAGGPSSLGGARIVVYARGFLDFARPGYDNFGIEAAGLYGTLPALVSSFGGEMVVSPELAQADLEKADVLLLLHPTEPWTPGQLERIEAFVREGGSLLVVAGPAVFGASPRGAVDDVLSPVGMAINYDVALPAAAQWDDALVALPHPATAGLPDRIECFGLRQSSSIRARWPARPILMGTWGHAEPGSDAAAGADGQIDPGERLGDLVLMAERPLGRGVVVALADDACLANLTTVYSHPFVGRLLGYLARRPANPQTWWRQALGLIVCLALAAALVASLDAAAAVAVSLAIALGLAGARGVNGLLPPVLPQGPPGSHAPLAYIDLSHQEPICRRPWSNEGIEGLAMALMRAGRVPLALYDWSATRLDAAATVVAVAPAGSFSPSERAWLRQWMERGGVFVLCAGATEAGPHDALFADLGIRVRPIPQSPGDPSPEPAPVGRFPNNFGRFATAYLNAADYGAGDYLARVWIFHGWPVEPRGQDAQVLVRGYDNVPLAAARPVGEQAERGWAVVIGDGGFALNYNMGYFDGQMVDGADENAYFWRWLLSRVSGGDEWVPPDVKRASAPTKQPTSSKETAP
ncbi:MAG: hypothetical protein JW809_03535 [Pirellulales bacterium]|nr:hypothetical protein [Pirellulales bacterium]